VLRQAAQPLRSVQERQGHTEREPDRVRDEDEGAGGSSCGLLAYGRWVTGAVGGGAVRDVVVISLAAGLTVGLTWGAALYWDWLDRRNRRRREERLAALETLARAQAREDRANMEKLMVALDKSYRPLNQP
jgi:hypothetical protein